MNQEEFLNNFYTKLEEKTNSNYTNKLKKLINSNDLTPESFESLIKEEFQ